MVSIEHVRQFALSFPDTVEQPHFELTSFRVRKKIFSTINVEKMLVMLKLTLEDQDVFTVMGKGACYPVPGGWGKQGATYFEMERVEPALFEDAMKLAWKNIAPKKLVEQSGI